MIGRTTDNNCEKSWQEIFFEDVTPEAWARFYHRFANVKIQDLLKENPSLLIFPQSISDYGDEWEKSCIFESSKRDTLSTGNIMGFVEGEGTILTIASRFYPNDDDYFLHYLLQKVFGLHQMDWNINSCRQPIWDFLPYLFPAFLKNAITQGIYKEYHEFQYNDDKVHGKIDVARHLKLNVPFRGRVASSSRELSLCNPVTLLIRATIDLLQKTPRFAGTLHTDKDVQSAVARIIKVTESFYSYSVDEIIAKNLRPVAHPYYTKYRPLQKLCLQILKHQKASYGSNAKTISGILFDGAWLWEEYLNTLLKKEGFLHPQNKQKTGHIYLFDSPSGKRYPDFYRSGLVFDAKYKRFSPSEKGAVGRDDLHQIITYMFVLDYHKGAFLYPDRDVNAKITTLGRLNGIGQTYGSKIFLIPFVIPSKEVNSYTEFCEAMLEQEGRFVSRCQSLYSEV